MALDEFWLDENCVFLRKLELLGNLDEKLIKFHQILAIPVVKLPVNSPMIKQLPKNVENTKILALNFMVFGKISIIE
jgi:hypothetical protein